MAVVLLCILGLEKYSYNQKTFHHGISGKTELGYLIVVITTIIWIGSDVDISSYEWIAFIFPNSSICTGNDMLLSWYNNLSFTRY